MSEAAMAENLMGDTEPPKSDVTPCPQNEKPLADIMDRILRSGTDEAHCFLNEGQIRANVRLFQEHFLPDDLDHRIITYAMKANPRQRILELMVEEGIDGLDCASANEIEQALALNNMEAGSIHYNNPVKSRGDLVRAFTHGVSYFTAQSRSGVKKILAQQVRSQQSDLTVAARLETTNPDAGINLSEKFGCSPDEAVSLIKKIKSAGARSGLAMHTGSQNRNPHSFVQGIQLMKWVAEKSGGISSINLGGGFPINYKETEQYDIREYLRQINEAVRTTRTAIFGKHAEEAQILIEPGRALVANAVDLAIPILEIERGHDRKRVYMNDGIFTSFSDAVIHGWQYNFGVFSRDGRTPSTSLEAVTLYGRTCDSGDSLGKVMLPTDLQEDDFLWVKNAGAYMDSQASGFNGFELPKYVSYNCYLE